MFVEDCCKELAEIQSLEARRTFVLAKAKNLSHMRRAEYVTLVAAADRPATIASVCCSRCCLADH